MDPCPKCGQPHLTRFGSPSCKAHRSNSGTAPCKNAPVNGTAVCKRHGAMAPQVIQAAMVRAEEARARDILSRLERPAPIDHPVYELLDLAAETREWQRIMRERMSELDQMSRIDNQGIDREKALVLLYERSLDKSARLLVDMAKLDLQTRALSIQQRAAEQVMGAVAKTLHAVGLGDHEAEFREKFAAVLREMRGDDRLPVGAGRSVTPA